MLGAIVAAIGVAIITWTLLEPMVRQPPLTALIGSLGLGYVFEAVYQAAFGAQPKTYESYPVESGLEFLGTSATRLQIAATTYAVASTCLVALLLRSRSWGHRLRAVAADPELAAAVFAIRQRRLAWVTVLVASVVAAPAAVFHAASHGVSPTTGSEMGLTAFVANIVAGRGRPIGAVLIVILLVIMRSMAITRPLWEIVSIIGSAGVVAFVTKRRRMSTRVRPIVIVGAAMLAFCATLTLRTAIPSLSRGLVVPGSFQDVVPYTFIVIALLVWPQGVLVARRSRVV